MSKKNIDFTKGVDLAELCITSSTQVIEVKTDSIDVEAQKAEGNKCPVCWKISKSPCSRHSA